MTSRKFDPSLAELVQEALFFFRRNPHARFDPALLVIAALDHVGMLIKPVDQAPLMGWKRERHDLIMSAEAGIDRFQKCVQPLAGRGRDEDGARGVEAR